jgi:hypothetical protein
MRTRTVIVAALWAAGSARAQDLAVAFRNVAPLSAAAADQHGHGFAVAGLSGITRAGGDVYWAVMDNSDKLVRLSIPTSTATGSSTSSTTTTTS